jgi:hypothetical protein
MPIEEPFGKNFGGEKNGRRRRSTVAISNAIRSHARQATHRADTSM